MQPGLSNGQNAPHLSSRHRQDEERFTGKSCKNVLKLHYKAFGGAVRRKLKELEARIKKPRFNSGESFIRDDILQFGVGRDDGILKSPVDAIVAPEPVGSFRFLNSDLSTINSKIRLES